MKQLSFIICVLISTVLQGQALRDINYNYAYNPAEDFSFALKPGRFGNQWMIGFKLQLKDTTMRISDYAITWEKRKTLSEKESVVITETDSASRNYQKSSMSGDLSLSVHAEPEILVARVINKRLRRAWLFYKILEPNYPVTFSIRSRNNNPAVNGYVSVADSLVLANNEPVTVSYYDDNFPASLPPFSEAQGKVSKGMAVDSSFTLPVNARTTFSGRGLYLIQRDTNATEGLAVRAEEDYPKFTKVRSLAGPMVYICTKQEYDRLTNSKTDKKQFDRVILSITNDTERAKKLIRNYFRRVELANQYFTSYKEGWKTDRGMIYIVFGVPDEVYKFQDREVWYYQADLFKANFTFLKSPTLFDPDNYVLIRDNKYQQTWYEVIDLWRSARF
jgi:GWxTD domain-containing protein